ncbi:MAG: transporter [Verrucomicrobiales bacterium]|nr:transporter [Verrucomicrobiales bacterium]
MIRRLLPTSLTALAATLSAAAEPALRDLSADRPDTTESPISVDAGHWQLETSFFDWSEDETAGSNTRTVLASNLKYGINDRSDVQFVFDVYTIDDAGSTTERGFGDVQLRYKLNLWGNDGGSSALALLPFVKIPTGTSLSNGEWEGGLAIPWSTDLTDRLSFGLMAEIDAVYDEESGSHVAEFLHTAVLGIGLTERWSGFVEYIGITGEGSYRVFGSGGLVFSVNDNLALDVGAQVGLNDAAEGHGVFTGMTARF